MVAVGLSYGQLQRLTDQISVTEKKLGQHSSFANWTLLVRKRTGALIRAADNLLCIDVPFEALGEVELLGRKLQRKLAARVALCGKPRLNPDATLSIRDLQAKVTVPERRIALNSRVLVDQLRAWLGGQATAQLKQAVGAIRIKLPERMRSWSGALTGALKVTGGGCLRPRASAILLSQPQVEAKRLRFAAQVTGHPTLEFPCRPDKPARHPPLVEATLDLKPRLSRLIVPIALSTDRAEVALKKALKQPIKWPEGQVVITRVTIDTSRGAVVVRLGLDGHTQGHLLGISYRRKIEGELIVWGKPSVEAGRIGLVRPQISLALDDGLGGLAAALKASKIKATIRKELSLPTSVVRQQARALLLKLQTSLKVGQVKLPLQIRTTRLQVTAARAVPHQLVLETLFEGWVVLQPADGPVRRTPRP